MGVRDIPGMQGYVREMHLYTSKKNRAAEDRPHGVNIPGNQRRLIKLYGGDTLMFTANILCPSTREPVKQVDLAYTKIYIALAENRFSPVLWAGTADEGWVTLDANKAGLVHVSFPRTVTNLLRRGSYMFSVVVDDGIVRETQLVGHIQVEYNASGALSDIPYRHDQHPDNPIHVMPEVDLASQDHYRLTYGQLLKAVDTISRTIVEDGRFPSMFLGDTGFMTEAQAETAVHKLSRFIIENDELRVKIPHDYSDRLDGRTFDQFIMDVLGALSESGVTL